MHYITRLDERGGDGRVEDLFELEALDRAAPLDHAPVMQCNRNATGMQCSVTEPQRSTKHL